MPSRVGGAGPWLAQLEVAREVRALRRQHSATDLCGPQLPVAAMALWRLGAVYLPLFTAFAGPSAALRVRAAGA